MSRLGALADVIDELPSILAGPLGEWAEEADPRLALWHACDAVEMALRLAVALGLGDWARAGAPLPEELRKEIARRLEQPTLGRWRGMALALAARPAPGSPLGDLWRWIATTLEPLLGGEGVHASLTELRNRLAHGGGLPHALAGELLAGWEPRLAAAFAPLGALADLKLEPREERVFARRGDAELPLWPLVAFATPPGEPRPVFQIYVRRGEVRLIMTPLGAERAAAAESSDAAVAALTGAGLLGEPPTRPPVELEVPGFEAELKRDAGQCVGRDAEVRAVLDAAGAGAGLSWLWGPAGGGKSLVMARAAREASSPLLAFRFKAGDVRCSRESFLRFVVERAAVAAGAAPPKGKPLREQARELLAGAKLALLVDGVDEIAAIDPGFVAEVLAPLGKLIRVIAAGRPEASVAAAMAAAGAAALFAGGLPPMSPDDVRAMLLDKVGPLAKKLVALDRDGGGAGGDVVNPFFDAVIERAGGLPVYVAYVIGDLLAGRLRALEEGELPPSLGAYHGQVLRRGGAGAAQQLVTPLVATLALAREPLPRADLHALLVHRVLATDDDAGRAALADALAQLGALIQRQEPDLFELFHHSLRDHVLGAADQAMAVATARIALGRAARELRSRYLDDHGVAHLLEAGDRDGAVAALAWPRLLERLTASAALPAVLADLRAVAEVDPRAADLLAFVRGAAHHLERGGRAALIQAALADGDSSPVTAAAEALAPRGLLRRIDRPARPVRGARQRTVLGHAAPVRALALAGDLVVSTSSDGTVRAWDLDDGSPVRTLSPPPTSFSATTSAVPAATPPEIAGRMPVLGAHGLCVTTSGLVVTAHGDGLVRAWDLDTGACVAQHRLRTYAWSLAPIGDRIAAACDDGRLRLLDARTLEIVEVAERIGARTGGSGAQFLCACAAVDGALVVAGASRGMTVFDPARMTATAELRGHDAPARALAAVPGTRRLLSASLDGTVALWDLAGPTLVARAELPGGAWSVAAERADTALVGGRDGALTRVALPDLRVLASAQIHAGAIAAIALLPDGRAVTGGEDRTLHFVDLDVAAAARPSHAGPVTAIAASVIDGELAIVTGGIDGAIKRWDARGRSLRTVPAHPDGVAALAASGPVAFSASGTTVLEHGIRADRIAAPVPLPAAPAPVVALAAPSADRLIAGCTSGQVIAWSRGDAAWGELHRHDGAALAVSGPGLSGGSDGLVRTPDGRTLRGHTWEVLALVSAADTLVSVGKEGVVIVWDPASGTPRLTLPRQAPSRCLAVSPDGKLVASATRDDCVIVWRASDAAEVARWTCDAAPQGVAFATTTAGSLFLLIGDAAGTICVLAFQ